jgi:hypothetical protein
VASRPSPLCAAGRPSRHRNTGPLPARRPSGTPGPSASHVRRRGPETLARTEPRGVRQSWTVLAAGILSSRYADEACPLISGVR